MSGYADGLMQDEARKSDPDAAPTLEEYEQQQDVEPGRDADMQAQGQMPSVDPHSPPGDVKPSNPDTQIPVPDGLGASDRARELPGMVAQRDTPPDPGTLYNVFDWLSGAGGWVANWALLAAILAGSAWLISAIAGPHSMAGRLLGGLGRVAIPAIVIFLVGTGFSIFGDTLAAAVQEHL